LRSLILVGRFMEENMPLLAIWFDGGGATPPVASWLSHLIDEELEPLRRDGTLPLHISGANNC
jgi:hypothetical protein